MFFEGPPLLILIIYWERCYAAKGYHQRDWNSFPQTSIPNRVSVFRGSRSSILTHSTTPTCNSMDSPSSPLPSMFSPFSSPKTTALAVLLARFLAWVMVAALGAFVLNVYLNIWHRWPGVMAVFVPQTEGQAFFQAGLYLLALLLPFCYVALQRERSLRYDAAGMIAISDYIAQAAFWSILLVGAMDATIAFLRVEGLLSHLMDDSLVKHLGRSQYRAQYVHLPLLLLGCVIAAFRRRLDLIWLALLIVLAELAIVISRFVFSYEQAFMGDLVRLWYAGLFLFSSAYTLLHEGHVRVDVFYAAFSPKTKGFVNAAGALFLGLPLCWTILILGMRYPSSIITNPLLHFEISQSGFGMYVKYIMAGYLAIFAITMAIHFCAYFLLGVADYRDHAKRLINT